MQPTAALARTRKLSAGRRLMGRPELGSIIGLFVAWVVFASIAGSSGFLTVEGTVSYLAVAASVGIIGSAVTLLMIGGEFDLSVGSMIGFSGMITALAITSAGLPLWVALLLSLAAALAFGFLQGWLVIRTGLPSFIVTLGGFFALRGLTIGLSRTLHHSPVVGGVRESLAGDPILQLFDNNLIGPLDISVVLFFVIALGSAFVLNRTVFGNWIYASGGSARHARELGVPVARVKVILFMFTAASAWVLANVQVLELGSADALRGQGKEFEGVLTAVIGGSLLFGGYGSPIGTVFGALTLGVLKTGLFFAGVEADWYLAILGVVLVAAVLINEAVRSRVSEGHK